MSTASTEGHVNPYKVLYNQDIKSASNIPTVSFIENVDEYLKDKELETVFKQLQEGYNKYKYFESKLTNNVSILTNRSKQLQETIKIIDTMETKQEDTFTMNYELSEGVFSSAEISKPKSVYLWLGANIMLEYSFDEAKQVLAKNLSSVEKQLSDTIQDLGFVKDQITTTDVNVSRVYNYDVIQRRKKPVGAPKEEEK
ncbi:prefoldin alpha-like domain containing protein [Cavenderia fasciculata]|uniref:Prefoldin subunit 3 n=1 Tax=Cavenderia fasciculata TaxID=261658 RepID=F4Q998_CACFS|nr:prefoldin alpha-like domain containing protein [Cavenderia fasciculata]EGG15267.1 prefoldin alpha-like domain containing protein [Cavenderia fasciculata]|eukprot:XP_004351987.1 prefoldin alpha-like domain containing protein [Cavenderia fasciculata]